MPCGGPAGIAPPHTAANAAACAAEVALVGDPGLLRVCIFMAAEAVGFSGCCVLTFSSGITGFGSESRRSAAIFFMTTVGVKAKAGESVDFLC